ncbi:MAG: transketolase C-terminal domain-containing protein [Candidatus Saccharibacteria bacterium]
MSKYASHLSRQLFTDTIEHLPTRKGFGEGLALAGEADKRVVALCADLTESTQMEAFAKKFPERYFEVGVAEQNLVTVASGLAATGKIPFTSSYAAFSPGRNWEQIRTTICLNEQPVKVVGSHAGVSVGPDGATHQMLEDIALMRVLPHMNVVVPADTHEALKATLALARLPQPAYLRLAREKTPVVTTVDSPFELGKAQLWREGADVTLIVAGPLAYETLKAAEALAKDGIEATVINSPSVKPLDETTILHAARATGAVVTIEEAQINGGLGGAVAELLSEKHPVPLARIGVRDCFGQSGTIAELWDHYQLTAPYIVKAAQAVIKKKG